MSSTNSPVVVLDDVVQGELVETFFDYCLPPGTPLVATSRIHHLSFDVDIHLDPLDSAYAAQLFNDRSGSIGPVSIVASICKALGHHPLAIVVSAGRVRREGIPLERLQSRLESGTGRLSSLTLEAGSRQNVWSSLGVSYEALNADERHVFTSLSACFGEQTTIELLASICNLQIEECEDIVGELVACSLLERDEKKNLRLHQLVGDFGRRIIGDRLTDIQKEIADAILVFLQGSFDQETGTLNELETNLPSIFGALDHAILLQDAKNIVGFAKALFDARIMTLRGYWTEAVRYGEVALATAEQLKQPRQIALFAAHLAEVYGDKGNIVKAEQLYEKALNIYETMGDRTSEAVILCYLGRVLKRKGDYPGAERRYEQSLELLKTAEPDWEIAHTIFHLGKLAQSRGDYREADNYYRESLTVLRELHLEQEIATSLHQMGTLAQGQGQYKRAVQLFEESIEISKDLGDLRGIAWTTHQLGTVAFLLGNYKKAELLYKESLAIKEQLGFKAGIAWSFLELGSTARILGDFTLAADYFEKCRSEVQELSYQKCEYRLLCQEGILARETGRNEMAIVLLQNSLRIASGLGDKWGMAQAYLNLGIVAIKQEQMLRARELFIIAETMFTDLHDQINISEVLCRRGSLARLEGEFDQSQGLLLDSLSIKEMIEDMPGIVSVCVELALLQEALGDFDQARTYLMRAKTSASDMDSPDPKTYLSEQMLRLGRQLSSPLSIHEE